MLQCREVLRTPADTAAGQRISLENGLVGFPMSLANFGATQNYRLNELEARNADGTINDQVIIPEGHWTFNLPNRLTHVMTIANSNPADPSFALSVGNVNAAPEFADRLSWRLYNETHRLIIPTGLVLQSSSAPFFIIIGGVIVIIMAKLAVRHRKNIEELPLP